jgi:5'-nucleotidase
VRESKSVDSFAPAGASDRSGHPLADQIEISRRSSPRKFNNVSVEHFMESDDESGAPVADASVDQGTPLDNAFARRPTAKPTMVMGSEFDLRDLISPLQPGLRPSASDCGGQAASLLQYISPPTIETSSNDAEARSAASSQRRDRVPTSVSAHGGHGWKSSSRSLGTPVTTFSASTRERRTVDMWRLLLGYVRVKQAIRRWRREFASRAGGDKLRTVNSLKASGFYESHLETADDIMTTHDNFDWHFTFSVPSVTVRGTKMFDATVNVSTSHIYFSNEDTSATMRLSEIMHIQPINEGLRLKIAPPSHSPLGHRNQDVVSTTQLRRRRRSTPAQQDDFIVIETDEASYIALHIFDFQSRILREYATSLSKTLTARSASRVFHVVHFNDVYHLPPFKPATARGVVGGASRFHTELSRIRENYNPLVLFSGDFMGPSLMSVITKGKQMIDALNFLHVHYGCFGNHEFDFGLKTLKDVVHGYTQGKHIYTGSQTTWVMSNMTEGDAEGQPLGGAKKVEILVWNGIRIGLLGLCENWIPQCAQLRQGEAVYHDVFEAGESLARRLKDEDGCEVVLALTHNRLTLDKELMAKCPSVDFLLGGHDHFYKSDPKSRILKSGQEFEYLSFVEFTAAESGGLAKVRIDTKPILYDTPQSDYMRGLIERYDKKVTEKLGKPIGTSELYLDSTEETIRFREALLPNFVLDIIQDESTADFAVLGAAAIAGKDVKPPGTVTIGDVFAWFPNDTRIMTVLLKGSTVVKMLNAMVRELPAEAPSFPHSSRSLSFTINMMQRPVHVLDVKVNGLPIENDGEYRVAVEEFVGIGKAKYKFVPQEMVSVEVSDENAPQLVHWVMDFFTKRKGSEKSAENAAREEALRTVQKIITSATRMEIDADVDKSQLFVRANINSLLSCDRSSVFLVDPNEGGRGMLSFTVEAGKVIKFPVGIGIAGQCALNNRSENIPDAYLDDRFNQQVDKNTGYRTKSILACPVCLVEGRVSAVVQAINRLDGSPFDEVDELKLRLFGEQVGFQLRNAEIYRMATEDSVADVAIDDDNLDYSVAEPTKLTKQMIDCFKNYAGEVSLSMADLLQSVFDNALKLVASENIRVFVRNANGDVLTLVEDVEDDDLVVLHEVEPTTVLATALTVAGYMERINNCRERVVFSRDRSSGGYQSALVASMTSSENEVVGAIVWLNRRNDDRKNKRFSDVDEFAAKFFGQFAAVAVQNTLRILSLNELRQETNLQAVPPVALGRIRIRGGWATVRQRLKEIPELVRRAEEELVVQAELRESHERRRGSILTSAQFDANNVSMYDAARSINATSHLLLSQFPDDAAPDTSAVMSHHALKTLTRQLFKKNRVPSRKQLVGGLATETLVEVPTTLPKLASRRSSLRSEDSELFTPTMANPHTPRVVPVRNLVKPEESELFTPTFTGPHTPPGPARNSVP